MAPNKSRTGETTEAASSAEQSSPDLPDVAIVPKGEYRELSLAQLVVNPRNAPQTAVEWPTAAGQLTVPVTAGDWVRQLEQANAAAGVYIVVHSPLHASEGRRAEALVHLRAARRLLADGLYGQAVAEARKILDILKDIDRVPALADLPVKPARDKVERWAAWREAVTGLANAAPHADPVTATITWDRRDATAVIATIAALFQRLD